MYDSPNGLSGRVSRSTLADANDSHDWRIFADFAQVLIHLARPLYVAAPIGVELDGLYALDSTTIDLCLRFFLGQVPREQGAVRSIRCPTCTVTFPRSSVLPAAKCMISKETFVGC